MNNQGLSVKQRRRIGELIHSLRAEFVVLIGSWARGTQVDGVSDIDLLVGLPSSTRYKARDHIHIIFLSSQELNRRVDEEDDLAIWSLKFGTPLSGHKRWETLRNQLLANEPWPRTEKKFKLATRALRYTTELNDMGDHQAAQEELRVSLGHLARALLLEKRVFPLSRPELPRQLRKVDLETVATMLDAAAGRDLTGQEISEFAHQVKQLIDRDGSGVQRAR